MTGTGATAADREVEPEARTTALARWAHGLRGFLAGGVEPETPPADPIDAGRRRAAGRVLLMLSLVPALLVTAWLLAAFPLVWAGEFRRVTVLPLTVLLALVLVPLGLRLVIRNRVPLLAPWWTVAATVLIAIGFTAFAMATHSEQVVIHRDNGSYAQIGYWLAHNHRLYTPVPANDYGQSVHLVYFTSPAYYQVGSQLVPQFMTGWPTILAGGFWLAGWSGEMLMPAVLGGLAMLAFAGLAARLIGPRWAPLAAALMGLAFPMIKGSQTTFSEIPAMLLLTAALCMLVDMIRVTSPGPPNAVGERLGAAGGWRRAVWPYAVTAGLVFGAGGLIRFDAGLDFATLLPVLGWLWASRRPGVWPYLAGAAAGLVLGGLDAKFLTWPYIQGNWVSVKLEIIALAASAVLTFAVAFVARNATVWPGRQRWWRWTPWAGGGLVALAGLVLFVRPYVMTAHQNATPGAASYLVSLQIWAGEPVDGSRSYAEQSLRWVSWYVGWPLLAAALVAGTVIAWRVMRGRAVVWLPALMIYVGSGALQLWQPSITPDHPYADRRLVTVILPGVILLATWTAALLTRAVARASADGRIRLSVIRPAPVVAACLVAVLALPAYFATEPVASQRTEVGEVAATHQVCKSLNRHSDSVVLVDAMSEQWMAAIRNECGVPVAQLTETVATSGGLRAMTNAEIDTAIAATEADIRAVGRTPVIAASGADPLQALGYPVSQLQQVVVLVTNQDQQTLTSRPDGVKPMPDIQFWIVKR